MGRSGTPQDQARRGEGGQDDRAAPEQQQEELPRPDAPCVVLLRAEEVAQGREGHPPALGAVHEVQ